MKMSPGEQQPSEQALFTEAIQYTGMEQEAFLDRCCAGMPGLRSRLTKLLAAHARTDQQFASPLQFAQCLSGQLHDGLDQIGSYTPVELLGEGGMGAVYRAQQQEPVQREVAIKIIHPGMDTERVIERFATELQTMALMNHPSIARVFDAGQTVDGLPFIVMELVAGVPITEYCDQKQYRISQRLSLFTSVCNAVQHAHQKGIIHLDLKPSNILVTEVDGLPVVKIIDFGVSRATNDGDGDRPGGPFIGTPLYMSPEQACSDGRMVDTRSDVYSLGAVLYELLTGTTPIARNAFAGADFPKIGEIIGRLNPPPASVRVRSSQANSSSSAADRGLTTRQLAKQLAGDLDTLVATALDKNPEQRYASASAFADDVQRFQRHEPLATGPNVPWYRLCKALRRHRLAFSVTALVAVVLMLTVVTVTLFAISAKKSKRLAEDRLDAQIAARKRADIDRKAAIDAQKVAEDARTAMEKALALAAAEAKTNAAINDFIRNDMLRAASPNEQLDRNIRLRTVVDQSAAVVQERFRDQPKVEAGLQYTLGSVYLDLGELNQAQIHIDRSLELHRKLYDLDSEGAIDVMALKAELLARQKHFESALRYSRQVFEKYRSVLGENHAKTCRMRGGLAAAQFGASLRLNDEAMTHDALAIAEDAYNRSTENLGGDHSTTMFCATVLAQQYRHANEIQKAEAILVDVIARMTRIDGDKSPRTLVTKLMLANAYWKNRRYDEGNQLLSELLRDVNHLGQAHHVRLYTLRRVAQLKCNSGEYSEAEALYREIFDTQLANSGWNPDTRYSLRALIRVYDIQGKYFRAASSLRQLAHSMDSKHEQIERLLERSAQSFIKAEHFEQAESVTRELLQLRENADAPDNFKLGCAHRDLARILARRTDYESAARHYEQGWSLWKKHDVRLPLKTQRAFRSEITAFYHEAGSPEKSDLLE